MFQICLYYLQVVCFAPLLEPETIISSGPELFIQAGSTINLTCTVRHTPEPPISITWSHGEQVKKLLLFILYKYQSVNYRCEKCNYIIHSLTGIPVSYTDCDARHHPHPLRITICVINTIICSVSRYIFLRIYSYSGLVTITHFQHSSKRSI